MIYFLAGYFNKQTKEGLSNIYKVVYVWSDQIYYYLYNIYVEAIKLFKIFNYLANEPKNKNRQLIKELLKMIAPF